MCALVMLEMLIVMGCAAVGLLGCHSRRAGLPVSTPSTRTLSALLLQMARLLKSVASTPPDAMPAARCQAEYQPGTLPGAPPAGALARGPVGRARPSRAKPLRGNRMPGAETGNQCGTSSRSYRVHSKAVRQNLHEQSRYIIERMCR